MNREKNFPQGFKRGDLVCWIDDSVTSGLTLGNSTFNGKMGIVVPPGSWDYVHTRGAPNELLWLIWSDGSRSCHLPGHMEVLAEAENNDL